MTDALLRFEVGPRAGRLFFSVVVAFAIHIVIVVALPRHAHQTMLAVGPRAVDVDLTETKEEVAKEEVVPHHAPEPRAPETPVAVPHRAPRLLVDESRAQNPKGDTAPVGEDDASKGGKVSSSSEIDGPPVIGSVTATAQPPPVPSPSATPPAPPPAVDRSRSPALQGKTEWSCPWPDEAEDIDLAYVVITVTVDPNGRATKVDVVDPGHGFGREARRCAMQKTYVPALDRDGRPITATTKPIRVRFAR